MLQIYSVSEDLFNPDKNKTVHIGWDKEYYRSFLVVIKTPLDKTLISNSHNNKNKGLISQTWSEDGRCMIPEERIILVLNSNGVWLVIGVDDRYMIIL